MRLFRHYDDLPDDARGAVAAIGNFEGLHLGHQSVVAAAGDAARAAGRPWAVISFEPHPYGVFKPDTPPFRLTPFRIKTRLFEAVGLDLAFALHFDEALYTKTADDFIADVLAGGLGISGLVIGEDFVFGRGRGGNAATLKDAAARHGFALYRVSKMADAGGEVYSSTKVREHLVAGAPERAAAILGRAWAVEGRVEAGDQRGRTIGFPTANLRLGEHLVPALGVYAVRAALVDEEGNGDWRDGVANLGRRPTVDGTSLLLETHLFDFAGDLYDKHLRVALVGHLRPEKKFDGIDALRAQIARDGDAARALLAADRTPLEIGEVSPPPADIERIA